MPNSPRPTCAGAARAVGLGARLVHACPHAADGAFQAAEYGFADEKVPDVELGDGHDRGHRADGVVGEAVPGVAFEAEGVGQRRRRRQTLQLGLPLAARDTTIGAGVQLDHRRAQRRRRLQLPRIGIDEQRGADAGLRDGVDVGLQLRAPAGRVETALGGHLEAFLGHDAGGVRPVPEGDRQHLLGGRHLEIERQVDLFRQPHDVGVGDVPAILAQMRGDAVGAGLGGQARRTDRIGLRAAAGVADGGDVVDVHAKT